MSDDRTARRQAALSESLDRLCRSHAPLDAVVREIGPPEPRLLVPGFAALLRIMVGQQVSTASAAAIWTRLVAAGGENVTVFRSLDDDALGRVGFSRAKMKYGRALADAVLDGTLDTDALERMSGDQVATRLMALPGIGKWTADIYRMFALGDPDVFPIGDLALREGVRMALDLPDRPDLAAAEILTAAWRPERSAAALLLWKLYRHRRGVAVLGADTPTAAGRPARAGR